MIIVEKDLKYYMGLNYPITVEKYTEDDGQEYFSVEIPDLPGCGANGVTLEEAFERLDESKELWLEESLKRGLDIIEPVDEDAFSGKFLIRIPARLHMNLSKKAKSKGLSLNQYIKSQLEQSDTINSLSELIKQKDKKIMDFLESQSRAISLLQKRLENLEEIFQYTNPYQSCVTGFISDSPRVIDMTSNCSITVPSPGVAESTEIFHGSLDFPLSNIYTRHRRNWILFQDHGESKP
jgi:antitoxin HicB